MVSELFEVRVFLPGSGAMRTLVRAETIKEAVAIAEQRYKGSRVEIPEQAAGKPQLVRSKTSPSLAARLRKKVADLRG